MKWTYLGAQEEFGDDLGHKQTQKLCPGRRNHLFDVWWRLHGPILLKNLKNFVIFMNSARGPKSHGFFAGFCNGILHLNCSIYTLSVYQGICLRIDHPLKIDPPFKIGV